MDNSDSTLPAAAADSNIVVLVDHVPEAIKSTGDGSATKDLSTTPETLSVLTDADDSLGSSEATTKTSLAKCPTNIRMWCGKKHYSDLIQEGVQSLFSDVDNDDDKQVVMIYESPASASADMGTSFYNDVLFQFHDYPISSPEGKTIMGPLRYAVMTGNALPIYLQNAPPSGLEEHWCKWIPNFAPPSFIHEIPDSATVCAYLPLEGLKDRHLIDPHVHYELAGKGAIPHMTKMTTKLLPDTEMVRPCVVKVAHSMGSRGIFVVSNDEDQAEVLNIIAETGNPNYVVTDFVDIERNLAAHFFIHPDGDITWFGSSENLIDKDGGWSADATIHCPKDQLELRALLAPYVVDVVKYCHSRGYWGACGIDVLLDSKGKGYVVDVNPRVTGTCPALMVFYKLVAADKSRFSVGTFRRSKQYAYPGTAKELLEAVDEHNNSQNETRAVVFSLYEKNSGCTILNIGVYGASQVQCVKVLNRFAVPLRKV